MALSPLSPIEDDEDRIVEADETSVEPTKTYELKDGYIGGFIDDEAALEQAIAKALRTARYRFLVYDDQYGSELDDLMNLNYPFELLEVEVPRMITDALIVDDRISDVTNFALSQDGDQLYVTFTVETVTGDEINGEVTI
ncbi:DUF2634 domain-containing protein [Gottfriedia sp. S16(2024)]|uniref:DUF2634 domain-containing protein n=1 Tax=Gottfriedia sp. S16(2024) TaxID=3162883 RepID=UPI003D232FA4